MTMNVYKGLHYEVLESNWLTTSRYRLLKTKTRITSAIDYEFEGFLYHCRHWRDGLYVLTAEAGLVWDGATGGYDTLNILEASLFHDIGCKAIYPDRILPARYQQPFDAMLRDIALEKGMLTARAYMVYGAVRGYQAVNRCRQIKRGEIFPGSIPMENIREI